MNRVREIWKNTPAVGKIVYLGLTLILVGLLVSTVRGCVG